jgi:hypothetical protein
MPESRRGNLTVAPPRGSVGGSRWRIGPLPNQSGSRPESADVAEVVKGGHILKSSEVDTTAGEHGDEPSSRCHGTPAAAATHIQTPPSVATSTGVKPPWRMAATSLVLSRVPSRFAGICPHRTLRYEIPGLRALKFVLPDALTGWIYGSLRAGLLWQIAAIRIVFDDEVG